MSFEISPLKADEAHLVWPFVANIAKEEMKFPDEVLVHYRRILTDEEIGRRSRDDKHLLIAARKDGKIEGILIGTPPEGGVATILWLLVSARCRREGIGKCLFEAGCSCFRSMGCHKIKLTAPTSDAVRFYEKQGMAVEGFHPDHWWHLDFWSLGKNL